MMQKTVVLSSFSVFFNYECSIIVESIIELTVYALDGSILFLFSLLHLTLIQHLGYNHC